MEIEYVISKLKNELIHYFLVFFMNILIFIIYNKINANENTKL